MLIAASFVAAIALILRSHRPEPTTAEAAPVPAATRAYFSFGGNQLETELETTRGELALLKAQYERADRVLGYSTHYRIPGDLAAKIFDIALAEGIDPELAFRLVRLESDFNEHATSSVGAVGLTQLMPSTARFFDRHVTRDQLYDRDTNLRIGFRYLRTLIGQYHGNAKLALLVYNRGEVAVRDAVKNGLNPSNGYERHVMGSYRGSGTIE